MSLGQGSQFGYRPGPIFGSAPIAGTGTGHLAAAGILAALVARQQTGRGQQLEVPMFFGAQAADYFGLMTWQLATGKVSPPPARVSSAGSASRKTIEASRLNYLPCTKDGRFVFFTDDAPPGASGSAGTRDRAHPRAAAVRERSVLRIARRRSGLGGRDLGRLPDEDVRRGIRSSAPSGTLRTSWPGPARKGSTILRSVTTATSSRSMLRKSDPSSRWSDRPFPHHTGPDPTVRAGARGELRQVTGPAEVSGNGTVPEHPLAGITLVEFGYFFAMPFATRIGVARCAGHQDRGPRR